MRAQLTAIGATDAAAARQAQPLRRRVDNASKYSVALIDALAATDVEAERARRDAELSAWIAADSARAARYGEPVAELAALVERDRELVRESASLGLLGFTSLVAAARTIVRMAEERERPDAERDPDYQARRWRDLEAELAAIDATYHPALERALLTLALGRMARERPDARWLAVVVGQGAADSARIAAAAERLTARPALIDAELRLRLFRSATTAQLAELADPALALAPALRPFERELERERERERAAGRRTVVAARYGGALRTWRGDPLAPDADGTLRITFARVRGYGPAPGIAPHPAFTRLDIVARMVSQLPSTRLGEADAG